VIDKRAVERGSLQQRRELAHGRASSREPDFLEEIVNATSGGPSGVALASMVVAFQLGTDVV
jgi:hypothetical protein